MDELAHTTSPNAKPKENSEISESCLQPCVGLNEPSRSLSLDTSGVNTVNPVTDSSSKDNPIKKMKKKNRKKGKKNSKLPYNVITEIEPNELGQDIGTASYQSSIEEMRNSRDDKGTDNYENKIVNCDKNTQRVPPPVIASCSACQPTNLYLKDANNYDSKLFSEQSFGGHTSSMGSHVLFDVWNNNQDDTVLGGKSTKRIMQGAEGLNAIENKIFMHCNNCSTKEFNENISLGYFSQYKPHETNNFLSSNFQGCNAGSNDRSKTNNHCTSFGNFYAVPPREPNNMISQSDMVNKPRSHHNTQIGKENSNSIWQKSRKNIRDPCIHAAKRSDHAHVQKDVNLQETLLVKHNSFSSNALLPSPIVSSSGHNVVAYGVQEVLKNKQGPYGSTQYNVMVESSRWVAQQKLQYDSELRQYVTVGNKDGGKFGTHNQSFNYAKINSNKKGAGGYKSNLLGLQNRMFVSQKDALEISGEVHPYRNRTTAHRSINTNQRMELDGSDCVHSYSTSTHVQLSVPHTTSGISNQVLLPGVQSYNPMKVPWTEHVLLESMHASLNNVQRNPACLDIKLSYDDKQDSNSRVSVQKWIPVGRKDSGILKNVEADCAGTGLKNTPNSCKGKAAAHPEDNIIHVSESIASVDPDKKCLMSNHETPRLMTIKRESPQFVEINKSLKDSHMDERARECITPGSRANEAPILYIGSQIAAKALNAAYKLQIASENVQLATGSPLAEFERLLHSATPVIASAHVLQRSDVCFRNQLFHSSLCKHQTPNLPLNAIWSWYEKPGNYGLEVKAEDSQKVKGLDADSISFNAHFVPFLSAVQLFGQSQPSRCDSSIGNLNFETKESGGESSSSTTLAKDIPYPGAIESSHFHVEELSSSTFESVEELMCSSENFPAVGSDSSCLSSVPSCFDDDMELLFEFFEHELPQQRRPFYDKVKELVKAGNSNYQVFGDPSKLECMNLHDLHPASWYSVAWYPIYRIPEGNFRASFLTYHALGHFIQRCSTDSLHGKQFFVVSPVLGLQSYNAKGECWFYPKKPVESCSEGSAPINSSEILKERLRTLEETALLFARGCVFKDHIKVANRQPDYEFFLSRNR